MAPMPGLVVKLFVSVGDKITLGQKLMTVEAMKMENSIVSTKEGVLKKLHVKEGDEVQSKQPLATIT